MDSSFKNKNILVLVFEIMIIALGVAGITFAINRIVSGTAQTVVTIGEYNVDYVGESSVSASDLEPISDDLININTTDNVIRLEFSLRGVSTNKDEDLIYDIMVNEMNIDCALLNQYTKWNLYKNGNLLSSGSFSPSFDGDVLSDNFRLTTTQEDLPTHNDDYDKYVFIIWISESCDDLETCELVDQSGIIGSKMSMKIFIALYQGAKKEYERIPNYDMSCANKPVLHDGMIPVTYKDGEWVIADENNSSKENMWYDYTNQKWANVVIVNTNEYLSKNVGDTVNFSDVIAQYVWIPRYSYKTWNVTTDVSDSYNAYDNGIDIIFESGLNSENYTELTNSIYVTHPAFSDNLNGFWISKYEMSNTDSVKFIPGVSSNNNLSLDEYNNLISGLVNDYKLGEDAESHIVNNLEWGATLYLSHSKYGVCVSDGCASIGMNETYVSGSNKQDTTTRNVYGVYDMSGSASEYVIGNTSFGSATSEVMLKNNIGWYNTYSVNSGKDYLIRGGINNGLFYYGDIGISTNITTRGVIINK